MNGKFFPLPFVFGAALILGLFLAVKAVIADLDALETALNPEGTAYEINADDQGVLWISDNTANEIWALDPATGVYTIYHGTSTPSDARRAADGDVWWVAQADDRLGRVSPGSNQVTLWDVPGASTLFGTAVDANGEVWLSEHFDPQVYRFDVASGQLCTYTLGQSGASDYILAQGGEIWLGDWINDSIHRLNPGTGELTAWQLPGNARPEGLAMDQQGHFWWADPDLHHLARLEPGQNRLTTFPLPYGSFAEMLTVSGNRIWYTEDFRGSLGRLDPFLATGSKETLTTATQTLTPKCGLVSPAKTGTLNTTTGTAAWSSTTFTRTVDDGGWLVHELPVDAYPWGIVASSGQIWFVDLGRQVLAAVEDKPSVTACKEKDGDGNLSTTDDQSPIEGWTLYLVVDGERQPGVLTGAVGCYTWSDLDTGVNYAVEESLPDGWTALTPPSYDLGQITPGKSYLYSFINAESVEVTACKLGDADGNLGTTGDQTPIRDWTVYLSTDGVRRRPGQLTGIDGCYAWSDLAPGLVYGVEEDLPGGWLPLTPTSHDFGEALPRETYAYTFVNFQATEVVYLPLILK